MRSRASRKDDATMDLFPFMAVLICTVGALIMLLVVMVQQARVKARDPRQMLAREQQMVMQQEELEKLQAQRDAQVADHERRQKLAEQKQLQYDEYQWKANILRSSYEQAVGLVADRRLALSHLESHTRELSEQAGTMQAEADLIAATAKQELTSDGDNQQQLQELNAAIDSAKSQLENTKEDLENVDPKYVLIPYDGPNGTSRRPIYIECLRDRVVLQPENVLLIGEDFLAPITVDNPLARALRAKREFLQENGLLSSDSEPYPLLVVRPGAAATYAAARSAMTSWESEFGYELVEADVELDYQQADPRLQQLLEDVVLETRGRRRMMRSMQARQQPRPRERLRPSASGGFESVGGRDGSFAMGGSGNYDQRPPFRTNTSNALLGNPDAENGGSNSGLGSGTNASRATNRFEDAARSDLPPSAGAGGNSPGGLGAGTAPWQNSAAMETSGPRLPADGTDGSGAGGRFDGRFDGGSPGTTAIGNLEASEGLGPQQSRTDVANQGERQNPFRRGSGDTSMPPGMGGSSSEATGNGGKGTTGSGGSSSVESAQPSSSAGGMQMGGNPASLASSRGSGWATNNLQPDAVGIQRPIYLVCATESISLLPEKGTSQELVSWQHGGRTEQVVDALVKGIQERLDSWGIAGQGIYWKPVLKIKVNPHADDVYRQLRHLLDDSGIEVTRQP